MDWISVEELLPTEYLSDDEEIKNTKYWVTDGERIDICYYEGEISDQENSYYSTGLGFHDPKLHYFFEDGPYPGEITHWPYFSLPKLPKEINAT